MKFIVFERVKATALVLEHLDREKKNYHIPQTFYSKIFNTMEQP